MTSSLQRLESKCNNIEKVEPNAGRRMATSLRCTPSSPRIGFLSLPAEMRFQIYELLFSDSWIQVETKKKYTEDGWSWHDIRRVAHGTWHQILLTCWPCYQEARGLWYFSTIWAFDSLTLRPFLDAPSTQPCLAGIKYVHLRDVHDLTQLSPDLLPSLEYVVAGVPNLVPWYGKKGFEDMDAEELFGVVKSRVFRDQSVKTRICGYLYHDGARQKFLRTRSFGVHFFIVIRDRWRATQSGHSHTGRHLITWHFLLDLDARTVRKHMLGLSCCRRPAGEFSCNAIGATS